MRVRVRGVWVRVRMSGLGGEGLRVLRVRVRG